MGPPRHPCLRFSVFTYAFGNAHVHACGHVNVCAYVCLRTFVLVCLCLHARVPVCVCTRTRSCVYVGTHICMCTFAGGHAQARTSSCTYRDARTCVHVCARVCPHLGIWWGRGGGTVDSRNNLLSFQATRPSARPISTSSVLTTHWVRAAPAHPPTPAWLSTLLLFVSLCPLFPSLPCPAPSLSLAGTSPGSSLIPYFQGF